MSRPSKKYKLKRNGDSVQFFEEGEYLGSIPFKVLCLLARNRSGYGTDHLEAQ